MLSRICLLVLNLLIYYSGISQNYGHEWIENGQDYWKIKIASNGFYRLTANELEDAGLNVTSIPSNKLKLFYRGSEIPINISGSGSSFNYMEFYGQKNDGGLDTELYLEPDYQLHSDYSLFADTSVYFLTYDLFDNDGIRIGFNSDNDNSGLVPETGHQERIKILQTDNYAMGRPFGSENGFFLSQFDQGEGWTGPARQKGQNTSFNFLLEDLDRSSNEFSVTVHLVGGNSLDHVVDVSVGSDLNNLRKIGTAEFSGWLDGVFTFGFSDSDVGVSGDFVVGLDIVGLDGQADRIFISAVEVIFPQQFIFATEDQKVFNLRTSEVGKSNFLINAPNLNGISLYDITDPSKPLKVSLNTSSGSVVIRDTEIERSILSVREEKSASMTGPYSFDAIISDDVNYLIITHPNLMADGDPIQSYANYRSSVAGGGYNVSIAKIGDIYDQFGYGNPSPLAIRSLLRFGHQQGQLENVFIIGKGLTLENDYYRKTPEEIESAGLVHLVPTYGTPGSDIFFGTGFGENPFHPELGVGRLNARTPSEVQGYLDKVIESEATAYDDLWRKKMIMISGGQNAYELNLFSSYVDAYSSTAKEGYWGSFSTKLTKETTAVVEKFSIEDAVNQGIGMITFFGHSGAFTTDIEIDAARVFQNKGKYPDLFLVNGCQAGKFFEHNITSFGEPWVLEPEKGSIAFIAHSNYASSFDLNKYSSLLFDHAFNDNQTYGLGLGKLLVEVGKSFFGSTLNPTDRNQSQVYQMILQGDPVHQLFHANAPDYEVTTNDVTFSSIKEGGQIQLSQDSFKLQLIIRNYGKNIGDQLGIKIVHTRPNQSFTEYSQSIFGTPHQDTVLFYIQNDVSSESIGTHYFNISVDPENSIEELNESNNQINVDFLMSSGYTFNLSPINDELTSLSSVNLIWQSITHSPVVLDYVLQWDTSHSFNSSYLKSRNISGTTLVNSEIDLSDLKDSITIFWRTRVADIDDNWTENRFLKLPSSTKDGQGQLNWEVISEGLTTGFTISELSGDWEFEKYLKPLEVRVAGALNPTFEYDDIILDWDGIDLITTYKNPALPNVFCPDHSLNVLVFSHETSNPYLPTSLGSFTKCGRSPYLIYSFTATDLSDGELQQLIDLIPEDDQVLIFNIGIVNSSNLDTESLNALESVGLSTDVVSALEEGQPFIFFGQKGLPVGNGAVQIISNGTDEPITEQILNFSGTTRGQSSSGTYQSKAIGKGENWESLSYSIEDQSTDVIEMKVFGLGNNEKMELISSEEPSAVLDLTNTEANVYPIIQFELSFEDKADLSPPKLTNWIINYEKPPDGVAFGIPSKSVSIQEGDTLKELFNFYNYTKENFNDSIVLNISLQEVGGDVNHTFGKLFDNLTMGDTLNYDFSLPTLGYAGDYNLIVDWDTRETEIFLANNHLKINDYVSILSDELNPIVEVTFDGEYILNGDFVSPRPLIRINVKDQNEFLIISDTSKININLKTGENGSYNRISFANPAVTYESDADENLFVIDYHAGPFDNGRYTLSVEASDQSGNKSGAQPYQIDFEVINESTITHFYPYPNPFSTSTKFVFTLTGAEVPDEIKIQIMTVSGRVVREILQDEIGNLKIGNNITDYAWNGKDEFGDQLANGVYFYRVITKIAGENIDHRTTLADRGFRRGFGKLYIAR